MVYVIIIVSIGFVIFLIRYFLLKNQVKSVTEQLRESKQQKIQLSLNNRLIERLAIEVNEVIDQQQKEKASKLRLDRELKQAIAGMSHDLRTPLTAIIGYLELLAKSDLTNEQLQQLKIAQKRADHLQQLINNLFALSTVDTAAYPMEFEKIPLNIIIKETLMNYYDWFEAENKQPIIKLPDDPIMIISDQNALQRVLENLLINALQHSTGNIVIKLYEKADQAIFSVTNHVDEDERLDPEQLLERFYTIDQTRQYHRGLGLSIVDNLMTEMNGKLLVKIESGEFHISCVWPKIAETS